MSLAVLPQDAYVTGQLNCIRCEARAELAMPQPFDNLKRTDTCVRYAIVVLQVREIEARRDPTN